MASARSTYRLRAAPPSRPSITSTDSACPREIAKKNELSRGNASSAARITPFVVPAGSGAAAKSTVAAAFAARFTFFVSTARPFSLERDGLLLLRLGRAVHETGGDRDALTIFRVVAAEVHARHGNVRCLRVREVDLGDRRSLMAAMANRGHPSRCAGSPR